MRLRSFLLPLAFCLFLATGCVHENSLSEQGSSLSPSSIRPDIPPEDIPAMELGGRRLVPAMYNWRVGGSLKQKRPKSEDRVDRNQSFPPDWQSSSHVKHEGSSNPGENNLLPAWRSRFENNNR